MTCLFNKFILWKLVLKLACSKLIWSSVIPDKPFASYSPKIPGQCLEALVLTSRFTYLILFISCGWEGTGEGAEIFGDRGIKYGHQGSLESIIHLYYFHYTPVLYTLFLVLEQCTGVRFHLQTGKLNCEGGVGLLLASQEWETDYWRVYSPMWVQPFRLPFICDCVRGQWPWGNPALSEGLWRWCICFSNSYWRRCKGNFNFWDPSSAACSGHLCANFCLFLVWCGASVMVFIYFTSWACMYFSYIAVACSGGSVVYCFCFLFRTVF